MEIMYNYLFGHIIGLDIVIALGAYIVRMIFDYRRSKALLKGTGKDWEWKTYKDKNQLRWLLSFACMWGLLIIVPDAAHELADSFFNHDLKWNALYSSIIGYAPLEIVLWIKERIKKKSEKVTKTVDENI